MWICKLKIKHDCIIGTRCEKFQVTDTGVSFNNYQEKGITYSPQINTLQGDSENIKKFLSDIKKDKRIKNLEIEGNSFFLVEVRKEKIPSTFKTEKLIFVKPIFVDKEGYEFWEIASWSRGNLNEFINHVRKDIKNVEILKMQKTKLTDIYFPRLMPSLTPNQKRAVELAFENSYYDFPKGTSMEKLAKIMKVSAPTFCEHLKKAEKKLMPNIVNSIK